MSNQIVARYADGRMVKGTSVDVDAKRPQCHVRTEAGEMVEVALAELKALFFVKSVGGDSTRVDTQEISTEDPRLRGSRLVEVMFTDREKIRALCMHYPPKQSFFFLSPVDANGNNLRILVNRSFVESITLVAPGGA
jgi:hypothetical protein